jgi:hypothetical protein
MPCKRSKTHLNDSRKNQRTPPSLVDVAQAKPGRGTGAPARCASHTQNILRLLWDRGAQRILGSELYSRPDLYGRSPRNHISELRKDGHPIEGKPHGSADWFYRRSPILCDAGVAKRQRLCRSSRRDGDEKVLAPNHRRRPPRQIGLAWSQPEHVKVFTLRMNHAPAVLVRDRGQKEQCVGCQQKKYGDHDSPCRPDLKRDASLVDRWCPLLTPEDGSAEPSPLQSHTHSKARRFGEWRLAIESSL